MSSTQLENEKTGKKAPRIELRMLSFDLDDRTNIARFLTDAGFSIRNESAANLERFERRIVDDEWDLIFLDARNPIEIVSEIIALVHQHARKTPIFAVIEPGQENQSQLMELGIIDLFESDGLERMPSSVTRELGAKADRELALEARRLQSEIKVVGDERAVLAELGRLVTSSLDIGQVYDQVIEQVGQLLPIESSAIAVADVETDSVTFEYVTGKPLPGFEQGMVIPMSSFTDANQLARFVLVLDTDLLNEMRDEFPGIGDLLDAGVHSAMSTPLIHRDEVVGILAVTSSEENAYGPEHVEAAERVGAQISGALANSRLHSRMTRIAQIREILVQIGRDASNARNTKALYTSVFKHMRELFPVDRGVIALTNESNNSLVIDHVDGKGIQGLEEGKSLQLDDLSDVVLTQSESSNADNLADQKPTDPTGGFLVQAGLRSNLRTPLRARDSVIGLISVSGVDDHAYTPANLSLLERVADQISPVIESLNLLERVQSLAATVERTLDLVAICDLEGVTSYINPAGLQLLNVEDNPSGLDVDLTDFISDEIADVIRTSGLSQAEIMGGWQSEISITPRDAENSIPVEIQLVPVRSVDNQMTAVNVFMRDLRDREAVQVERREFVSTVSHELRTPLTSMKMYTDMLGEGDAGELNDQQQRLVNNMKSTVDRLSRMVDDLNVVSMLEAGRFSLQSESFDMEELVVSAIEIAEPNFAERGIAVRTVQPDTSATVDADKERILQVLVNLLINSAKYADADTEVVVSTAVDNHEVRIEVADKGPGIEEGELETVFESFYRSKSARISRVSGSGLGLSIARGFVEAQGGRIWAESTVGEGSKFIFTLPLVLG
ncbi:MAG: GAF domain-containing protein [Chloroflexi bacterium]|nr:GAF domain-containing protein [Chloroflexota bacterium]MBT5627194.1 GAF domain-containing protein [Chloroflexota bacterium]